MSDKVMTTGELLPCPFCAAENVDLHYTGCREIPQYRVICGNCDSDGCPCDTEADAVACWNDRQVDMESAAARVLGRDYDGAGSPQGDFAEALATVERLRVERDRLLRLLAVERGDESQAPEGWATTDTGSWRMMSQAYRVVCRTRTTSEKGYPLYAWEAWVDGRRVGVYPFALEAIDAAAATP